MDEPSLRLSSLHNSGKLPKVYFNENLTRANRELFWMARSKAKEVKFKYVWVKGGKLFAKKEQGSALVRVNKVNDLENISSSNVDKFSRMWRFQGFQTEAQYKEPTLEAYGKIGASSTFLLRT